MRTDRLSQIRRNLAGLGIDPGAVKDIACWNESSQRPVIQLVIPKSATSTIRKCLEYYDNGTRTEICVDDGHNYLECAGPLAAGVAKLRGILRRLDWQLKFVEGKPSKKGVLRLLETEFNKAKKLLAQLEGTLAGPMSC
jgi:hypothetical protein